MGEAPTQGGLQGGWWPQSRDLAVQLADHVGHLPPEWGRIVRAAACLLNSASEHPDVDPEDHWSDDGGAWIGPHPAMPSVRTGT
jgi:uncharacterized protein DUF5994